LRLRDYRILPACQPLAVACLTCWRAGGWATRRVISYKLLVCSVLAVRPALYCRRYVTAGCDHVQNNQLITNQYAIPLCF